jgi:putative restriction endonuclease
VPSLARLFSRPPSSVLAKMANLDGSRAHGARWDALAGAMLRDDPARFSATYRVLLAAARAEGISPARLPDFLGLEHGGELALLGQEELGIFVLEAGLRDQINRHHGTSIWSDLETERILLAAAPVGQHLFARQALANCSSQCVFCGLRPSAFGAIRMLLAGHIKPWKDSTPPSASTPATAWPPARPTTSPSTPACSPQRRTAHPSRPPTRYRHPGRPASQAVLRDAAAAPR